MPDLEPLMPAVKQVGSELFQSMDHFLESSETGKMLKDIHLKDYLPALGKAKQALTESAQHASSKGNIVLPELIERKAANIARRVAYGHNDAIAAGLVKAAYHEKGPTHAAALADHLAMIYHDNVQGIHYKNLQEIKTQTGIPSRVSSFKSNIWRNKDLDDIRDDIKLNDTPVFTPAGPIERGVNSALHVVAAPFIVVPHATGIANLAFDTPPGALMRGMLDIMTPGNYKSVRKTLLGTGILADTQFRAWKDLQEYKIGKLAKVVGPSVAYALHKMIHAPGMNAVREWSLVAAGSVAKHVAEDSAQKFIQKGDKYSERILRDMAIDPSEIMSSGGKLTQDQLDKAVFRFVDNHLFIDRALNGSYLGRSNWFFRAGTMYHGFQNAQRQFLVKGFMQAWKEGNPARIAQFMGMLSTVAPVLGETVNDVQDILRGDFDKAKEDFKEQIGQKGISAAGIQYIHGLAAYAGFAIWGAYARKIAYGQFLSQAAGPAVNIPTQLIEDGGKMIYAEQKRRSQKPKMSLGKTLHAHKSMQDYQTTKQFERDILNDTLPDHLGTIASHILLPTAKEEKKRHPTMATGNTLKQEE